jgi:hypothetical protein
MRSKQKIEELKDRKGNIVHVGDVVRNYQKIEEKSEEWKDGFTRLEFEYVVSSLDGEESMYCEDFGAVIQDWTGKKFIAPKQSFSSAFEVIGSVSNYWATKDDEEFLISLKRFCWFLLRSGPIVFYRKFEKIFNKEYETHGYLMFERLQEIVLEISRIMEECAYQKEKKYFGDGD